MCMSVKVTGESDFAVSPGGPATTRRVTFEEYLAFDDERAMSEWVDGEVIYMSPTARRHQEILTFSGEGYGSLR